MTVSCKASGMRTCDNFVCCIDIQLSFTHDTMFIYLWVATKYASLVFTDSLVKTGHRFVANFFVCFVVTIRMKSLSYDENMFSRPQKVVWAFAWQVFQQENLLSLSPFEAWRLFVIYCKIVHEEVAWTGRWSKCLANNSYWQFLFFTALGKY